MVFRLIFLWFCDAISQPQSPPIGISFLPSRSVIVTQKKIENVGEFIQQQFPIPSRQYVSSITFGQVNKKHEASRDFRIDIDLLVNLLFHSVFLYIYLL